MLQGDGRGGDPSRMAILLSAAGTGALAGLAGVTVMTLGEKLEQAVTHRPDSYVPARALLTLLGRAPGDDDQPLFWNYAMHVGTGVAVGTLRGGWSVLGLRGSMANAAHTLARLAFDQTVENGTGVGAPPHTWPLSEQVVDVLHKGVYSFVTGLVSDRLVPPRLQADRGRASH